MNIIEKIEDLTNAKSQKKGENHTEFTKMHFLLRKKGFECKEGYNSSSYSHPKHGKIKLDKTNLKWAHREVSGKGVDSLREHLNENLNESLNEVKFSDTFLGVPVQHKPRTKNHRPAIWENMLATVYAMNDQYQTKYFAYNFEGAKEWANIANKKDIRLARYKEPIVNWTGLGPDTNPIQNRLCVWVETKQTNRKLLKDQK